MLLGVILTIPCICTQTNNTAVVTTAPGNSSTTTVAQGQSGQQVNAASVQSSTKAGTSKVTH